VTPPQAPRTTAVTTITRRFPPAAELATVSLALVIVGGIIMASYAPQPPPLAGPVAIASAAAALLLASVIMVSRLREFAWNRFFTVLKWAGLAYLISAGMIAFAFIHDHTRGAPLAVVLVMLVMFASDVPLIIAFTAARYSSPPHSPD
jgi:hypothetical protein